MSIPFTRLNKWPAIGGPLQEQSGLLSKLEFLGIYLAQETATALESFPLCELMHDLQAIASKIYDMQEAEGPAAVDLETDLDDSPKDLCKRFRLTARFCD